MSFFGAIGRTALKSLHSNNRLILRHSSQPPNYVSYSLVRMFGKMSRELENEIPERPKRPQSGYNTFFKDLALKLRAENPDLKVNEMAKTIGQQWTHLDPNLKQEILENSKKNSEEYKEEIEKWRKSLNEQQMETYLLGKRSRKQGMARRRLKSELKRLDHPIRPKSAFNLYIKESIDNRQQTDEPFKEVFKRIVAKWGTLTPEDKVPYIETAKSDKIRYLQELNEWQTNLKKDNKKETLDKLTKLKALSSRSYLTSDLKKEKTKKVVKKRAKPKRTQKIKAKPKVKSSLKTKSKKAAKPKIKKSSKPKTPSKPKESKAKKAKSSAKIDSSDSD